MPDMEGDGTVRITLKDVYQQTQSLEKSLGDAFSALNLTLQQIRSHIEQLDSRNAAADQIHVEHSARLSAMQAIIDQAQPVATRSDFEARIRSLERFKYTLLGAVIVINSAAAWLEWFFTHRH